MITAGIDAGSRAIKIVVYDSGTGKVLGCDCCDQGIDQQKRTYALFVSLLEKTGLNRSGLAMTIATGYGRHLLDDFCDTTITEITCHSAGVLWHMPQTATVIDIGGQDSKLIRLDGGKVQDFAMNDRCAAGTGRFLEVVSQRLEVPLDQLGACAQRSSRPAAISSICVVFAETEIVGLLAGGQSPENIIAGVQQSIARRLLAMAGNHVKPPVVFTGGVAMISGMKEAFEHLLAQPVTVCREPQFTGALGAALLAAEKIRNKENS